MVEIELFKSKCCNAEAIMDFGSTLTDFVNDSGKKPGDITFPQVHTVSFVCSKCHKPCNTYDLNKQLEKSLSDFKPSYTIKIEFVKLAKLKNKRVCGRIGQVNQDVYKIEINKDNTIEKTVKALIHEYVHFVQLYVEKNTKTVIPKKVKEEMADRVSEGVYTEFKIRDLL